MDVTQDAFANLVTQFSSELDFLRELVQNSMDAGSSLIDVWTEFHPDPADTAAAGTVAIHVDDHGEGMDEAIIDDQLTTLFSSTKENDLTKIGKFGIGFVSVFAIDPKAVVVHTGRAGEFWEIFFHEDRSFSKTRLETPVEGTQITLFVEGDAARYRQVVVGALETLRRWCRHSNTEVSFEDRSSLEGPGPVRVNEPFDLEAAVKVSVDVEGTQMVLGYRRDPSWSFYNKGLTLAEVRDVEFVGGRWAHVAFKIKSRYLEHTLSRETVIRDENYERAMALLGRVADGELRPRLVSELRELAATPRWAVADHERYFERLFFLSHEHGMETFESAPILRTVDGRALALTEAWEAARADDRLFVDDAATELSTALGRQGIPVFLGRQGRDDAMRRLLLRYIHDRLRTRAWGSRLWNAVRGHSLSAYIEGLSARPEEVFLAVSPVTPEPALGRLLGDALALIEEAELAPVRSGWRHASSNEDSREAVPVGYDALVAVRLDGAVARAPLFLTGRAVEPLMALPPEGSFPSYHRRKPVAALNVEHPHLAALVQLATSDAALGAYALARSLTLAQDRLLFSEVDLLTAARTMDLRGAFAGQETRA